MQNFIQKCLINQRCTENKKHHAAQVMALCEAEIQGGRLCFAQLIDGMGWERSSKKKKKTKKLSAIDNHGTEEI
jgi:hypothetical protein